MTKKKHQVNPADLVRRVPENKPVAVFRNSDTEVGALTLAAIAVDTYGDYLPGLENSRIAVIDLSPPQDK